MKHIDIVKKKSEAPATDSLMVPKQEPVPDMQPAPLAPAPQPPKSTNSSAVALGFLTLVIVAMLAAAYYFYRSP